MEYKETLEKGNPIKSITKEDQMLSVCCSISRSPIAISSPAVALQSPSPSRESRLKSALDKWTLFYSYLSPSVKDSSLKDNLLVFPYNLIKIR